MIIVRNLSMTIILIILRNINCETHTVFYPRNILGTSLGRSEDT